MSDTPAPSVAVQPAAPHWPESSAGATPPPITAGALEQAAARAAASGSKRDLLVYLHLRRRR